MTNVILSQDAANASTFFDFAGCQHLALHKIHKGDKAPIGNEWQHRHSSDPIVWPAWIANGYNIGINPGASGIAICDVERGCGAAFKEWCNKLGFEPPPPHMTSPSGGFHTYFRLPDSATFQKQGKGQTGWGDLLVGNANAVCAPSYFTNPRNIAGKTPGPYVWNGVTDIYDGNVLRPALTTAPPKAEADLSLLSESDKAPIPRGRAELALKEACAELRALDGTGSHPVILKVANAIGAHVAAGNIGQEYAYDALAEAFGESGASSEGWERAIRDSFANALTFADLPLREKTTAEMFPSDKIAAAMADQAPHIVEPYTGPIPLPSRDPIEKDYYEEPSNAFVERSFSAATLAGKPVPDRDWLINDWVPNGQVTMIYGDGGVGKSLIAIHMAACSAAAVPWFGRSVKHGNAIFMTAEDSRDEIHIRLDAISREHRIPLERMARLFPSSFADTDAVLASLNGENQLNATKLYDELVEVCEAGRPSVVVLDTLADIYGANENVRQQVRAFVAMLRKIAIRFKCAVVVLAHPSLSGLNSGSGTGGSTAWNNSIRSRMYFDWVKVDGQVGDPDLRVLKLMKSNYSKIGTEIHMRYQRGAFVPDRTFAVSGDPLERQAKADRVFLELLEKARGQNINIHVGAGKGYAVKVFKADASAQGVNESDLKASLKRLMDSGRIVNAPYGRSGAHRLQVAG